MTDCPRCHLTLQFQRYEGTDVLFCATCWGHWLNSESLERILESKDYGFSRQERETVFRTWVIGGTGDVSDRPVQDLNCPICRAAMSEVAFADDCPVLVDRCEVHGTWLDAGEIKKLQVFVESR